jgi:hypothetical protein
LASSAVAAAEDVRKAIRVARTAANARAAASSAALTAQSACERGDFSNLDDVRAAQTRASIAQSHAIHSAVIEHEAKIVKRRATLALANDVETWNIHRKKEMLRACVSFARSQHEAARRAVDAWSTLRDGFIGPPMNPSVIDRKSTAPTITLHLPSNSSIEATLLPKVYVESDEVTSSFFDQTPTIIAVDHNVLSMTESTGYLALPSVKKESETLHLSSERPNTLMNDFMKRSENAHDDVFHFPFAEASEITECDNDLISFGNYFGDNRKQEGHSYEQRDSSFAEESMGESMQSIVNGIINKWGLGFESDDDHLALPVGMAASILLEEDQHSFHNPAGFKLNII